MTHWPRITVLLCLLVSSVQAQSPKLRVTPDGHYIETTDGKPFFLLADTAWEMFHRLKQEDADWYLEQRAKQGFTVVDAVALPEFDLSIPNAYGDLALHDMDPTKPNEAYFARVDAMVQKANSLGLYIGFVPTWGDKWNIQWGKGPEIFTPENARIYGEWLGKRYKDAGLIWILGGDRSVDNDRHKAIIRAMAEGLRAGDGGSHLITFHPNGSNNSGDIWPDEKWLDLHTFQSGHSLAKDKPNYETNLHNWALTPVKPTFEGEPRYEDHPVRGLPVEGKEWYDAFDVRQAAWWNMFSGACGHTYGNHNIWQFFSKEREPIFFARTPWKEAVFQDGAKQMGYMKAFMKSFDWQTMDPADELLKGSKGEGGSRILAMISQNQREAVFYTPHGFPVQVDLKDFKGWTMGMPVLSAWFNPRTGRVESSSVLRAKEPLLTRTPQGSPERGNDWVLWLKLSNATESATFMEYQQQLSGEGEEKAPQ